MIWQFFDYHYYNCGVLICFDLIFCFVFNLLFIWLLINLNWWFEPENLLWVELEKKKVNSLNQLIVILMTSIFVYHKIVDLILVFHLVFWSLLLIISCNKYTYEKVRTHFIFNLVCLFLLVFKIFVKLFLLIFKNLFEALNSFNGSF